MIGSSRTIGRGRKVLMRKLMAMIALFAVFAMPAAAQDFGRFAEEPINAPGAYGMMRDPTGTAPQARVHMFRIDPGACAAARYDNGLSDCDFNSVRSQVYETRQTQPTEAWYAWDMYLPSGFPLARRQIGGGNYSFAYWHNRECPNLDLEIPDGQTTLVLRTNVFRGAGNCRFAQRLPVIAAADLTGWHQFEMHVRWSSGSDGFAEVYVDGQRRTRYDGPTITVGTPDYNYFKFGIYLNSGRDTRQIAPAWALFTTPERGRSRLR